MQPTPPEFAYFVGIDWADQKHDVAVIGPDKRMTHEVIDHSAEAIDAWASQILEKANGRPVAIILEQSKGALIHALMFRENIVLFPVNPKQFARYRESFSSAGSKDDKSDARFLARMLFERHKQLRAWMPDDAETRLISRLCSARRQIVNERTRLAQQLLDQVKGYFPQLLKISSSMLHESPLILEILRRWPDPREFNRQHPKSLARLLEKHGYRKPEQQQAMIDALKNANCFATTKLYW